VRKDARAQALQEAWSRNFSKNQTSLVSTTASGLVPCRIFAGSGRHTSCNSVDYSGPEDSQFDNPSFTIRGVPI
jgi:hypothetical protein